MESNEKTIDGASTLLTYSVLSGLMGLGVWCFGVSPKGSLGFAIVAFFLFLLFGNGE